MPAVRRAAALVAAVAVLSAACSTGASRPRQPPWAGRVDRWLANAQAAAREGVPNLSAFLAPDVVVDRQASAEGHAEGRDAVLALYRTLLTADPRREMRRPAYLSTSGLVVPAHSTGKTADSGQDTALLMTFSPRGLLREESALSVVSGRWRAETWQTGALPRDWEPLEVVADRYLAAWSQGDRAAAAALYDPAVAVRDGLIGTGLDGLPAVEDAMAHRSRGLRVARLPLLGGPAVFGEARRLLTESFDTVVLLLRGDDRDGCRGRTAVVLTLGPAGTVVGEERYHRLDDARRCPRLSARPPGWWDELPAPPAVPLHRTGTVTAGQRHVEVWNGSPELTALLRWAIGRFALAGLPAPEPASVTFYPAARSRCGGYIGLASGQGLTEITLCFGNQQACPEATCPPWSADSRNTVLHELAHTWMSQQLGEARRERYLSEVHLPWADPTVPWPHRGVERAADTIAWGLDLEQQPGVGLGRQPREQLAAEFRLLTGHEPL